jgi:PAS domain S-box-containing protein
MSRLQLADLTGREKLFSPDDVLTSKTDLRGVITYANDVFSEVAGFTAAELYGAPHSLIRHPEMPRAVFALMWSSIEAGKEFFGYVVNRCKSGDHYWVLAHIVPDLDPETREIVGYHSTRRCPSRAGIAEASKLYSTIRDAERRRPRDQQVEAGIEAVTAILKAAGVTYEQWIFAHINRHERLNEEG